MRGEVLSGIVVGALAYAGLVIIGVPFALVLALLATVGELVPVVGPIAAAVPAVIIAFLEGPTQGIMVVVFYGVLQQVESNIILPNVMRHQAHLPPLLTILALFAGAEIGGVLGAILAVPLAGALKVLVLRLVVPAVRGWTGVAQEQRAGGETGSPGAA